MKITSAKDGGLRFNGASTRQLWLRCYAEYSMWMNRMRANQQLALPVVEDRFLPKFIRAAREAGLWLNAHANSEGDLYLSRERLCALLGITRNPTDDALAVLLDHGLIRKLSRGNQHQNARYLLTFTPEFLRAELDSEEAEKVWQALPEQSRGTVRLRSAQPPYKGCAPAVENRSTAHLEVGAQPTYKEQNRNRVPVAGGEAPSAQPRPGDHGREAGGDNVVPLHPDLDALDQEVEIVDRVAHALESAAQVLRDPTRRPPAGKHWCPTCGTPTGQPDLCRPCEEQRRQAALNQLNRIQPPKDPTP